MNGFYIRAPTALWSKPEAECVRARGVKTRERFRGIGQLLTMPLFFASNSIYPLSLMPDWLRVVSRVNPLSYQVDALRALMIQSGVSNFGLAVDFGVLLVSTVALVMVGARLYQRVVI